MAKETKKLIIGPGRLSFPHLFEPNAREYGGKYQCTLLLPPDYDFGPLKTALLEAATAKFGPDKSNWPRGMRGPSDIIRKCEEKANLAGYLPGWHFVAASSQDQPGVVDAALAPVTNAREAYPGRWAKMSVNVFAFSNVKHGVSLGLQNVQLTKHDDAFSGRARPEDEFEEMLEDMEDAGDYDTSTSSSTQTQDAGGWDD